MKRFKLFFLCVCFAFGLAYLANNTALIDALTRKYKIFSSQTPSPKTESKPISPQQKAEIDFHIQQQYQKTLSHQEHQQEILSEEEKLEILTSALTELDHAEDEYDRELAVMTLGETDDPLAKQGLLTALQDESAIVVTQAIRQINQWPNASGRTEMLLTALQHPDDEIVLETLLRINVVDDPRLVARLKQLRQHHNPEIRDAANLALNLAE